MKLHLTLLVCLGLIAGIFYQNKVLGELMAKIAASDVSQADAQTKINQLQDTNTKDQERVAALEQELATTKTNLAVATAKLEVTKADLATAHAVPLASSSPSPSPSPSSPVTPATSPHPASTGSIDPNAFTSSMAIIEGDQFTGSGFIAQFKDGPRLVTNAHVLSGNNTVKAKFMDGKSYSPDTIQVAQDCDIASFATDSTMKGVELLDDISHNVAIGDAIIVLGNSMGAGVVTQITGKVTGIGPNLVEIDAEFVSGNSGSPIIHVKTGKVIGIATYTLESKLEGRDKDSKFNNVVRRFAYRLDTVPTWKTIGWTNFVAEALKVEALKKHTEQFVSLLQDVSKGGITWSSYTNDENYLKDYISDLHDKLAKKSMGGDYYLQAKSSFFQSASDRCTQEISGLDTSSYISYHKGELDDIVDERNQIATILRNISNNQDNSH